jgi:4Fe-4S ferredoxin
MKRYKKERDGKLEAGLVIYTKHFRLEVDRALCKGCQLCRLACPKQAIAHVPQADADGKAVAPLVDLDEAKCDFCGVCALACPFSAISVTAKALNEDESDNRVGTDIYPAYLRDIKADNDRCKPGCKDCEVICSLGALSVDTEKGEVAVNRELCAGCTACWMECPEEAITVAKFIEGEIQIDAGKCPEGCVRCRDVCPVNAIEIEDGEAFANDYTCIYCGACAEVCPQEGALRVERTAIRHTPVDSGTWNKALEKLTSAEGLQRELAAASAARARQTAKNTKAGEVDG